MAGDQALRRPVTTAPRVRVLDDVVVNQIAAGEVVERPASVVKELVENSIDAGANDITVILGNAGKSSIEILDNGCGMSKADALLAMERFGTSKISTVADLRRVSTLGFRGEALPSIASVSKFRLSSRPADDESGVGVELEVHGGKLRQVIEKPLPHGTRIRIDSLFYNVPARKKFLRAEATEVGLVKALLLDVAASHPELRLKLVSDGSELLALPPAASFRERIPMLGLGDEPLIEVQREVHWPWGVLRIEGALRQPLYCVSGSGRLRIIVNGRPVRDRLLLGAIREGYGNFLKSGRYPVGLIKLELPAEEVDVNVHPQKAEVRFRSGRELFSSVANAVAESLQAVLPQFHDAAQGAQQDSLLLSRAASFHSSRPTAPAAAQIVWSGGPRTEPSTGPRTEPGTGPSPTAEAVHEQPEPYASPAGLQLHTAGNRPLSEWRFVGQLFEVYLVMEGEDKVAIVDMHAAHERVMFYKIKSQLLQGAPVLQPLLLPEVIVPPPECHELLEELCEELSALGIRFERSGETITVHALPAVLGAVSPRAVFEDLFSLAGSAEWTGELTRRHDAVIARLACHGSVRSGRVLSRPEVYSLLESLEQAEASAFCPHGRPVVRYLRETDLELMFGR